MKNKIVVVMLAAVVMSASTFAALIPIVNAGFEETILSEGAYDFAVPGWDTVGPGPSSGSWNPDDGAIFYGYGGEAPEGLNVAWIAEGTDDAGAGVEGGIAQLLAETLTADTTYTLTVEVGNSYYYAWGEGYKVQLLAGGILLAEDDSTLTPATDTFELSTVMFDSAGADAGLLGQALEIRLLAKAGNGEADFDDVQLSAVPEPATIALLGMGILMLKRKRK